MSLQLPGRPHFSPHVCDRQGLRSLSYGEVHKHLDNARYRRVGPNYQAQTNACCLSVSRGPRVYNELYRYVYSFFFSTLYLSTYPPLQLQAISLQLLLDTHLKRHLKMRFITAAASAGFLASHVLGHPHASVIRKDLKGRSVDLNAFRLTTTTEYSNVEETKKSDFSRMLLKRDSYVDSATAVLQSKIPGADFRVVDDHYVGTNGVAHVNFKQTVHGLDIDNADFNVNVSLNPLLCF